MTNSILCTLPVGEELLSRMRQNAAGFEIRCAPCHTSEEVDRQLDESVEILFTQFAPTTLQCCPKLQWTQLLSAGINHVLGSPIFATGRIRVTTSCGIYNTPVAEFAVGLMISLARQLPAAFRLQSMKQWCPNRDRMHMFSATELYGKRVGILGYGGIGQEIARLCQGLSMIPSALVRSGSQTLNRRYVPPHLEHLPRPVLESVFYFPTGLNALLSNSDVVVIALPLTRETDRLIDASAFARMKPTSHLINISRGGVVDESALVQALETNQIAGAALDVFAQEPLPSDSPLFGLRNLIITPHISGAFDAIYERAVDLFLTNLSRYKSKKDLFNLVDRKRGY